MNVIGPNRDRNYRRYRQKTERNKLYVRYLKLVAACIDCGSREDLTFDHLPQFKKVNTIASLVSKVSFEKLRREIAKCEIVCHPCHEKREIARGRMRQRRDRHPGIQDQAEGNVDCG